MTQSVHFRNFLGPPGSSLCGLSAPSGELLTLDPNRVVCEKCRRSLGLLRAANIGVPGDGKPTS